MGLFDIFKSKGKPQAGSADRPFSGDKNVARYADALTKRAQNYDRQEAIDALSKLSSPDAAAALLKRFTFVVDPSITDQEEKESAFRAIVSVGKEALGPTREFCLKAESVTWPLRIMRELLDDEAYVGEVLAVLQRWDTEYDRNPDPKIQLLSTLEEIRDPRIYPAVERFLEDVHEPTRFHAATTILEQGDPAAAGPLARALVREEAMRTKNRIADGLVARAWPVPQGDRDALADALPRPFAIDGDGVVRRSR